AEDGIRDRNVTGVQTCALPISPATIDNRRQRGSYDRAVVDCRSLLESFGVTPLAFVPISARNGDNLVTRSERMSWYEDGSLIDEIGRASCRERVEIWGG